ncbi:hypothetical protein C8A05DRAFT_38439 [Staphylotrichum tortipilum]|uniref:Uncharacterized protein n=1 Tax=Staphylotrichum tortipilum TaxID=2831512 RepID=A0AAN6MCN1_9PEZI|nr:hypothetical protein C8A05DRAFT_38439 [Staphylotrichum longicolle]
MSVEDRRLGSSPSLMTLDRQMLRGYLNLPAPLRHVPILSGFSSKAAKQGRSDPFISESAFDLASTEAQELHYSSVNASTGSWFRNETSRKSRSSEHLSVHLAVSLDLGLVGGGVSGTYDKNVVKNSDALTISRRCSIRCGDVRPAAPVVPLSRDAKQLLQSRGPEAFQSKFGDFYVSGLGIGGDSGVCLSMSSASDDEVEDLRVMAEVHVLFWTEEVEIAHKHRGVADADMEAARRQAVAFADKVDNMDGRIKQALQGLGIMDNADFDAQRGRELWRRGLVAELTLLPFSSLREVQQIVASRSQ